MKMNNKMANGWKVAFWIILILFLLETMFIIFSVKIAIIESNNKIKCMQEICLNADFFHFEDNVCSCYKNNNIIHQAIIK
jgi:hypothetical protein